jgi:uncharacterized membrane protein YdjX (TVP38/TMEM64 family)
MDHALTFLVYATTIFLTALEALILWKMATDKLDLRRLIANEQGGASLSRLQLLVFTFVIAAGFLYLTAKGGAFPVVSGGVLVLLGISGATYAIGKSLDKSSGKPASDPASVPKAAEARAS